MIIILMMIIIMVNKVAAYYNKESQGSLTMLIFLVEQTSWVPFLQ